MYPTLEEADAAYYPTQGKGWDQKIGNLSNAAVGVMQPDDGDQGRYWISNGAVARRAFPHAPQGHYYRIEPTYAFYELRLAATPEAMAEAVRERAQHDLYNAHVELRNLSLRDPAKAPLDEVFTRAATEWHVGEHYLDPVFLAKEGSTGLVYRTAKAIRAFARCQSYARQVLDSLIPPPSTPSDLGLLPWEHWTKDKVGE